MLFDFSKMSFDIIIQGGQSNSHGCGVGPADNPYFTNDAIWYIEPDGIICKAHETVWGNDTVGNFALAFARKYVDGGLLDPSRKLLIIRAAVPGTGFLDNRWSITGDLYIQMISLTRIALILNPSNRLVAFLWHQGETDAMLGASFNTHYINMTGLLSSVRTRFNCEDLPFIAGDFVHSWSDENEQICKPVLDAIRTVCQRSGHADFVTTEGLESNWQRVGNDDTIHFCREALYRLGERYFDAYAGIKASSKIN